MASSSQHRCVFVGNIPYDATEEQLIEICREVGPVVSFRLVIDRETGKPKGYGFCEYKDEETALSARRNLQGYEINGRQLRVDFAENDKGADRNREQGRGGPGLAANADTQKQLGGPVHGESANHQPIGLHIAITAAAVMAGALGGPQTGLQSYQNGLQSQLVPANDPLTLQLAKMSRSQLNEIMSELKVMATQNKELARQLLLARPQLLKALFQAQIMLGMVTPQVLQMPNIRQAPGQPTQPSLQDPQKPLQTAIPTLPRLPPLAQKTQPALVPKVQESQLSAMPQTSQIHDRFSAPPQPAMQRVQLPQHASNNIPQQATLLGQAGVPTLPSANPSVRPQINQQMQPALLQHRGQVAAVNNLGYSSQMIIQNAAIQSSLFPRPSLSDAGFQPGQSISAGLAEKASRVHESSESISRPSKSIKLDDGKSNSFLTGGLNVSNTTGSGPSQAYGASSMPVNLVSRAEQVQYSEEQISKSPVVPDMESALLQQVLNLTPEQLCSLPPEQRQQVIQLQQALRRDQMQPS